MTRSDSVIFTCFHGKFAKLAEPRLPNNANFFICWNGKDWSGFRTLAECEKQFEQIQGKPNCDSFSVVERLYPPLIRS